jgi:hypothetical protein
VMTSVSPFNQTAATAAHNGGRRPERPSFDDTHRLGNEFSGAMHALDNSAIASPRPSLSQTTLTNAHKDFESIVLKNMFETMLPDGAENVFGKGIAGETWKSMMAEQLAAEVVRSGGLGIAARLAATAPVRGNAEVILSPPTGIVNSRLEPKKVR